MSGDEHAAGDELAWEVLAALAGVPDMGELFRQPDGFGRTLTYRVTGWARKRDDPGMRNGAWYVLGHSPRPYNLPPLEYCERHRAEYVCGFGICGVIVALAKVQVCGRSSLTAEQLASDRRVQAMLVGKPIAL